MGALVFLAAACTGCARSAEDIQQEFDDVVAGANSCSAAADCALIAPGCPLGCFVAVNAAKKDEVEAKAKSLIEDYQRGGRACAYDCAAPGPVACVSGRCDAQPKP